MGIAHRLSTLRTCNRIIVMDKGSIKETGSHDELMKIEIKKQANGDMVKGWYRDLYETQHGKSEDSHAVERLKAELANARQELSNLKEENLQLRGDTIKSFKLGKAKRNRQALAELAPLNLVRHTSENAPQ